MGMIAKRACRQWHGCLLGISVSRISHHISEELGTPARQHPSPRDTRFASTGAVQNPILLQLEELPELLHRLLGPLDRVADRPGVLVDLVVVPALEGLVAKEVDRRVSDPSRLLGLVLEVLKAVGLVPACREDVEGDLAADGEAVWRKGRRSVDVCFSPPPSPHASNWAGRGEGAGGTTHVRPRWPKRSRSLSTNFSRTWCSLSYFS